MSYQPLLCHTDISVLFLFYFYESTFPVIIAYKGFLLLFFKKKKREGERKPAVVVPIVRPMSPNGGCAHSGRVFNFEIRSLGKKK